MSVQEETTPKLFHLSDHMLNVGWYKKICDHPGNLFYWPAATGGDPDFPVNGYRLSAAELTAGWMPLPGRYAQNWELNAAETRQRLAGWRLM